MARQRSHTSTSTHLEYRPSSRVLKYPKAFQYPGRECLFTGSCFQMVQQSLRKRDIGLAAFPSYFLLSDQDYPIFQEMLNTHSIIEFIKLYQPQTQTYL